MAEQPHSIDGQNKVSFLKGVSLFPWDWKHIGASANRAGGNANQSVGARVTFTTRSGSDESGVQYGRVLESSADLSVGLKSRDFILALSAGNVAVRSGSDDPKRVSAGQAPAGLKLTLARQFNEDNFIGASYDVRLNKPELSVCWTGETFTEKASLMLTADPLDRTLVLRAALATPGPEWRRMLYNEDNNTLEPVQDDGAPDGLPCHVRWMPCDIALPALQLLPFLPADTAYPAYMACIRRLRTPAARSLELTAVALVIERLADMALVFCIRIAGGRHRLWVTHNMRQRALMAGTQVRPCRKQCRAR